MTPILLSMVAPFFNEVEGLPHFAKQLREVCDALGVNYEVILVDDGSTDGSAESLSDIDWPQCSILELVANSGHQNALDAGLHFSQGDFVVTMDADGQHPPVVIPTLLGTIERDKLDVVYALPVNRNTNSWFKRATARLYYKSMKIGSGVDITENAADFRIMSRFLVDTINRIPEEKVFRLLIPSLGFRSTVIDYDIQERKFGRSKYTLTKMGSLAVKSVFSFSVMPLRWVSLMGLITALAAFVSIFLVLFSYFSGNVVPGWASVMLVVLLLGGLNLMAIGVIGEYMITLQKIARERPHYLVKERRVLGSREHL